MLEDFGCVISFFYSITLCVMVQGSVKVAGGLSSQSVRSVHLPLASYPPIAM